MTQRLSRSGVRRGEGVVLQERHDGGDGLVRRVRVGEQPFGQPLGGRAQVGLALGGRLRCQRCCPGHEKPGGRTIPLVALKAEHVVAAAYVDRGAQVLDGPGIVRRIRVLQREAKAAEVPVELLVGVVGDERTKNRDGPVVLVELAGFTPRAGALVFGALVRQDER